MKDPMKENDRNPQAKMIDQHFLGLHSLHMLRSVSTRSMWLQFSKRFASEEESVPASRLHIFESDLTVL